MQKKIIKEPHAVLHMPAEKVPIADIPGKKIQRIIQEMKEVLRKTADGIGLAAPQIGYSLQMYLASEEALWWKKNHGDEVKKKNTENTWDYYVFINPVLVKASRKKVSEAEGCLSVPGTYGAVERSEKVTVEAYDEHGNKFIRGTSSLYARVMQHEVDHLNGILFIAKAKNVKHITHKI